MAVTLKDESITRGVMFLCLGAAAVLFLIQWRVWVTGGVMQPAHAEWVESRQRTPAQQQQATPRQTFVAPQRPIATTPPNTTKLVVDLSDRRVYLYKDQQQQTSYPLAVGQSGWETPTGNFQVLEMQRDPQWMHPITKEVIPAGPENPLGKRWIGFLANEETHIGFHGTNQEELIGQAVSHGCLRMRNQDVIALYEKVAEGTPVIVKH